MCLPKSFEWQQVITAHWIEAVFPWCSPGTPCVVRASLRESFAIIFIRVVLSMFTITTKHDHLKPSTLKAHPKPESFNPQTPQNKARTPIELLRR